ncbi:Uncharacterised protein [Bordetella pertussis]|nr:Uncharacterised protein [Bordetella pertussis]
MRSAQEAWMRCPPHDGLATQATTTVIMNRAAIAKPGMMPARYSLGTDELVSTP